MEKRLTAWAKRLERILGLALFLALLYAVWLIAQPHLQQIFTTTITPTGRQTTQTGTGTGTTTQGGAPTTTLTMPTTDSLVELNAALEHAGYKPITLPANYNSFDVASQFVVLLNLVRVDMGLAPLHRNTLLDSYAQAGAVSLSDPTGPGEAGGVWANYSTASGALYAFLFADGFGQGNIDCTTPTAPGCWGHRRILLADYGQNGQIGAAFAWVGGQPSLAASLASAQSISEVTPTNATSSAP